jgi:hypothetical protein
VVLPAKRHHIDDRSAIRGPLTMSAQRDIPGGVA